MVSQSHHIQQSELVSACFWLYCLFEVQVLMIVLSVGAPVAEAADYFVPLDRHFLQLVFVRVFSAHGFMLTCRLGWKTRLLSAAQRDWDISIKPVYIRRRLFGQKESERNTFSAYSFLPAPHFIFCRGLPFISCHLLWLTHKQECVFLCVSLCVCVCPLCVLVGRVSVSKRTNTNIPFSFSFCAAEIRRDKPLLVASLWSSSSPQTTQTARR